MNFSDLETRVNASVNSKLSNKALIIDGVSVSGIFTRSYSDVGFIGSNRPVFIVKTEDIPDIANEQDVRDGDDYYKVVDIKPDGAGMTVLELHKE